jgi:hypothetical protein
VKRIFLSYRRNDSAIFTGRLFDRLADYYGADAIFLDIDSISDGVDFREAVAACIRDCGALLAIIGEHWAIDSSGRNRLAEPGDPVCVEIEQALLQGKPVIPIYCGDRTALSAAELPASLASLVYANARWIDPGRDFNHHVLQLRRALNQQLFRSRVSFLDYAIRRFLRRNAVNLMLLAVFACGVWVMRDAIGRRLLSRSGLRQVVADNDPEVFSPDGTGSFQLSRVLVDRNALISETDLDKTIREATRSFDVFALTGSAFFNRSEALKVALQDGVKFRILLLDHSPANAIHVNSYFQFAGGTNNVDWSATNARQAVEALSRHARQGEGSATPGTIEVRWWQGPFINSFWIRDGREAKQALAHTEITYFGDQNLNPSLRFGRLSPLMIDSLQAQFDYMWNRAKPALEEAN